MTDDLSPSSMSASEPSMLGALPSTAAPTAPTPQKPSRAKWWIPALAGLGVVSLVCVCLSVVVLTVGGTGLKIVTDRPKIEAVLDGFMSAMVDGDTQTAFDLFSQRAQGQITMGDLETMLEGNNAVLFSGYRSVTIDTFNLTAAANTDPKAPQGTVAKVVGTITYAGGITGQIEATLEEDGGQWGLFYVYITVPPDKFQ